MFSIIRTIIGCIFLGTSIITIKNSKSVRKRILYVVFACLSVMLIAILAFLPFENLFVTFDSPEAAYEYYILGESNIELIVEGNDCDFVVDRENNVDKYLIIPKTSDGWKIGVGTETKRIAQTISNGIIVDLYQYKNSSDYFIVVFNTNGGITSVSDDCDSVFYSLERYNEVLQKTFYIHCAHIPNLDSQYNVTVNGNEIALAN